MRALAFGAILVLAFVGALLIGRGSDGEQQEASAAPQVKDSELPVGTVKAPALADTGKIPDLESPPAPTGTADTGSAGTASTPSATTGTTGTTGAPSTGGGSTGGGSTGGGSTGGGGGSTGGGGGSPPPARAPG